jgi:hypothetical protein
MMVDEISFKALDFIVKKFILGSNLIMPSVYVPSPYLTIRLASHFYLSLLEMKC